MWRSDAPRDPPVAPPGEADAHPLLVQLVAVAGEDALVEVHEVAHLVRRPTPVLGREGVTREPAAGRVEPALDGVEEGLLARGVTLGPRQATLAAPSGRCRPSHSRRATGSRRGRRRRQVARRLGVDACYGHSAKLVRRRYTASGEGCERRRPSPSHASTAAAHSPPSRRRRAAVTAPGAAPSPRWPAPVRVLVLRALRPMLGEPVRADPPSPRPRRRRPMPTGRGAMRRAPARSPLRSRPRPRPARAAVRRAGERRQVSRSSAALTRMPQPRRSAETAPSTSATPVAATTSQ